MAQFGGVADVRQVTLLPTLPRYPVCTFELLVWLFDVGQEREAVLGEFHPAAVAHEQRSAHRAFEARDGLADAGRTSVQALGRPREM